MKKTRMICGMVLIGIVVSLLMTIFRSGLQEPADVSSAGYQETEEMGSGEHPKKWYYALPIVVIWILIIGVIVRAV